MSDGVAAQPEQLSVRAMTVVALGAGIVLITMGARQSFGLFLEPVSNDLGAGRETFSLALALQNLIFGLPIIGMMSDRIGSRRVVMASGAVLATGLIMAAAVNSPAGLYLSFGPVIGLAISGASFVVVLGAVGREVPQSRRTLAFGIITAAGSFGMFVLVPVAQFLLDAFGWRESFSALAGLAVTVVVAGWFLPRDTSPGVAQGNADEPSLLSVLGRARRNSSYLLLVAGFFVCGFHVAFIATHLKPYLTDEGLSGQTGAIALSLIGLFNIAGSVIFGRLGDRYRNRTLLAMVYVGRSIAITLLLVVPLSAGSAIAFGAVIGFLWLATVPLTTSVVDGIFGPRYLSTLFGIVFFSHQLGAFIGVWLGGRVFDQTGSYDSVWVAAIVLGVVAALVHLPIQAAPDRGEERAAT